MLVTPTPDLLAVEAYLTSRRARPRVYIPHYLGLRDQRVPWASYQIRKIAGCACAGNAGNVFPRRRFQRKPIVGDRGMHHGTCVTHVPWCMSGSLTCGDGENVPGIPGACAPVILRIWQEAHTIKQGYNADEMNWPISIIHFDVESINSCKNRNVSRCHSKIILHKTDKFTFPIRIFVYFNKCGSPSNSKCIYNRKLNWMSC